MTQSSGITLVRIPTTQIRIDSDVLVPTTWDRLVIQADLTAYVSRTRRISATPAVAILNDLIFAINGAPFIKAAQNAQPPVDYLICGTSSDINSIRRVRVETVDVSELLDRQPPDEVYDATEMLFFDASLDVRQKESVERAILSIKHRCIGGHGNYARDDANIKYEWSNRDAVLTWQWTRSDAEGRWMMCVKRGILDINGSISIIRSWNGLILETERFT